MLVPQRERPHLKVQITGKICRVFAVASLLFVLLFLSGCSNKFFDPTQVGRFRPVPAINVILDSLGVAEETPAAWEHAQEPLPVDTLLLESDYVFRSGDVITVAIFELLQEGVQFVNNYVVTETGKVSIPEVGIIEAAGLTETQLEAQIRQILSPGILKDPSVAVALAGSQQRAFSILGDGVLAPGRYPIPRYNFRLADALATAGGARQFNVSYIYVSRSGDDKRQAVYESHEPGFNELKLEVIEPDTKKPNSKIKQSDPSRAQQRWPQSKIVISSSEMATDSESAGMPESFEWQGNHTRNRMNTQSAWESTRISAPESTDETVSVTDILNTLDERSRREQMWLNSQIDVDNALESFRMLMDSKIRPGGRIRHQDSFALSSAPSGFRTENEPADARSVLKKMNERYQRQRQWLNRPIDVENAQESFMELNRTQDRVNVRTSRSNISESPPAPVRTQMSNSPDKKQSGGIDWVFRNGKWVPVEVDSSAPTQSDEPEGHVEWIFRNGKWVPMQVGQPRPGLSSEQVEPARPPIDITPGQEPVGSFREAMSSDSEQEKGDETRLIRIPADKLLAGTPRYNIVIKPGDTIFVPVDSVGEFYIMGNVNRTGTIPITGRPMTLKMAIAAAGGLGPLAWPKRCEVIRRIGRKREEIIMVDLDKIASGEQPDFFIKPNDLINVGTHPTSRWRAVLRNAFRATYGFGFVYDRNFADRDYYTHRPFPSWF
jgi:protein involved in polysaccharide export with SLBB domain